MTTEQHLSDDEAITVVGQSAAIDDDFLGCMDSALRNVAAEIKIIPPDDFREALFPWFEPGTIPTSAESIANMMASPVVRNRVTELGVRYVIVVGGRTSQREGDSWGGAVSSGAGAVGLGGISIERNTWADVIVLDMEQLRPVAEMKASAASSGEMGILLFIPYGIPPGGTESSACQALAHSIIEFLTGNSTPPTR